MKKIKRDSNPSLLYRLYRLTICERWQRKQRRLKSKAKEGFKPLFAIMNDNVKTKKWQRRHRVKNEGYKEFTPFSAVFIDNLKKLAKKAQSKILG